MHWRAGAHPLVDRVDRLGRIERRVEVETAMSFLSGWSATLTLPDYGRFARDLRDFAMGGPGSIGARSS